MKINLDVGTKQKLKQLAKEEARTVKKQVEIIILESVEDIKIEKQKAGFQRW